MAEEFSFLDEVNNIFNTTTFADTAPTILETIVDQRMINHHYRGRFGLFSYSHILKLLMVNCTRINMLVNYTRDVYDSPNSWFTVAKMSAFSVVFITAIFIIPASAQAEEHKRCAFMVMVMTLLSGQAEEWT